MYLDSLFFFFFSCGSGKPIAIGGTRYFAGFSAKDDDFVKGSCFEVLAREGEVGKVVACFEDPASREAMVEYLVLWSCRKNGIERRPYWGHRGLLMRLDMHRVERVADCVGSRAMVETYEVYRRRVKFPSNAFYVCDGVRGDTLRVVPPDGEEAVADRGRHERIYEQRAVREELESQKTTTTTASSSSIVRALSRKKTEEDEEEDDDDVMPAQRLSYVMKKPENGMSKRPIAVAIRSPRVIIGREEEEELGQGGDCVFQDDSEEERRRLQVLKGVVEEPVDSSASDVLILSDVEDDGDRDKSSTKRKTLRRSSETKRQSKLKKPKPSMSSLKKIHFEFMEENDDEDVWEYKSVEEDEKKRRRRSTGVSDDDYDDEDEDDDDDGFIVKTGKQDVTLPSQFQASLSASESFCVWLEYIFFCESDSKFRKTLLEDPENMYASCVNKVERRIRSAAEVLGGGGHWYANFGENVRRWSKLGQGSDGRSGLMNVSCQVCGRTSLENFYPLRLHGDCYDAELLWEHGILKIRKGKKKPATVIAGESCRVKVLLFHELYHYKIKCLDSMQKMAKKIVSKDDSLNGEPRKLVETILMKDDWASTMFQHLERLLNDSTTL